MTSASPGFSLLELLVAVAVTATLATGVTLVASYGRRTPGDAAAFAGLVERESAAAVLSATPRALRLTASGVEPLAWRDGLWSPTGGGLAWRATVEAEAAWPFLVLFWPDGRTGPFALRFADATCRSDPPQPAACGPAEP